MADDLTKPFFGNPAATAQGAKGRKLLARTYEDTWLDSFLKGIAGEEEPTGSVLDPNRQSKVDANNVGQLGGILTDLGGPVKVGLGVAAGALPMLASVLSGGIKQGAQKGAIRIGGAKDLVATHAFSVDRAASIADSGFLKAPSIGIHSLEPNDYGASSPQFVFRAGAIDPSKNIGTMVNRDGYFANPRSRDPEALKEEIANFLRDAKSTYGGSDLRNLQGWPGSSQGLAIGASPDFKSFAEYEKSPWGAQLLRENKKSREYAWNKLEGNISATRRETGLVPQDLIKKVNTRGLQSLDEDELRLWMQAQNVPSAMAEFKMYEHLPLSPNDAYIHVPTHLLGAQSYARLAPLRDQGFKMVSTEQLDAMHPNLYGGKVDNAYKALPLTVPPDGTFNIPKIDYSSPMRNDSRRPPQEFLDFVNPGAGGSPPLAKAPGMLPDDMKAMAKFIEQTAQADGKGIHSTLLDYADAFSSEGLDQMVAHFKKHPNFKEETVIPKASEFTDALDDLANSFK